MNDLSFAVVREENIWLQAKDHGFTDDCALGESVLSWESILSESTDNSLVGKLDDNNHVGDTHEEVCDWFIDLLGWGKHNPSLFGVYSFQRANFFHNQVSLLFVEDVSLSEKNFFKVVHTVDRWLRNWFFRWGFISSIKDSRTLLRRHKTWTLWVICCKSRPISASGLRVWRNCWSFVFLAYVLERWRHLTRFFRRVMRVYAWRVFFCTLLGCQ